MEGVIVPSSPGNSTRLRTRLRSSSSDFLVRKKTQSTNRNYALNHKNYRNAAASKPFRNAGLRPKHHKHHHVLRHDSNGNASKSVGSCFNGKFTREVYHAICGRLGHTPHIPGDSVQALFNDMQLYPSKSEVSEMLHCARQVGRRNGSYLTIGEFCVLAREMQRPKLNRKPQTHKQNNKCTSKCEVFLGGSCNPTTWRTDTAIPELQKHGISYYNPQVSIWAPELVAQEHDAKQSASLLLYVIDSQTRSVAGMIEVGYLVAAGRCVVLVACPYREGQTIMDEPITQREYVDLANGQTSLLALVKSQGIKVHTHLSSALQCTASILRNTSMNNGMTAEEQVTHKLRKLRETFDFFDSNRSGEIQLMDVVNAYHLLTNKKIDMRSLCNYLRIATTDVADTRISFDQFCALVAEFSTDGCESFTPDGRRIGNSIFWDSALLKTRHVLQCYIARPLSYFIDWISHPLNRNCSTNNNIHYSEIKEPSVVKKPETRIIDIYLGGSCDTQVPWRENVIPLLKKQGITYYNPAIREIEEGDVVLNGSLCGDSVCESNVLRWKRAMDKSTVLLFYITNDTRSLTTMILAAHYIGLERNVVLCIEHLPHDDIIIDGEKLTKQAIKDYNRGRVYLHDLAKRKQVPVFENITEAVQTAADRSRSR